jgi:molecular chaperone Hsp31 and glyoxalase 3
MLRAISLAVLTLGVPLLGSRLQRSMTNDEFTVRKAKKRIESEPNSYYPSEAALQFGTMKEYRKAIVHKKLDPPLPILVLASSEYLLPTADGSLFNTGHQTTEIFLPMHHFDAAGFTFDFATEEGAEVAIEEWTFEMADGYKKELEDIRDKYRSKLEAPMKYTDVKDLSGYAAIFLPGGHGPLIRMQFDQNLKDILTRVKAATMPTISLCHGPVSFTLLGEAYKGYRMAVFPDKTDETSPNWGYLPSKLGDAYHAEAKLKAVGVSIVNEEMDRTVVVHKELVTGASQLAAQPLSEKALEELAKSYSFSVTFPSV